jgi:hypothetical protein
MEVMPVMMKPYLRLVYVLMVLAGIVAAAATSVNWD